MRTGVSPSKDHTQAKLGVLISMPLSLCVPDTAAITITLSSASIVSSISTRKSSKAALHVSQSCPRPSGPW
jgi:hypothetical protein